MGRARSLPRTARAAKAALISGWRVATESTSRGVIPVNLPALVNSAFDDFCPTPLSNGDLFFVSRRPNGCSENSADIFLHPYQGLLGSVILNCEVNSAGDEFSPSYVPAGGGTLFFSSNRDGTHKIYASAGQPGGAFGEPVEVTELNAPGFNTFRPNVSEDGLEIVFDSDCPGVREGRMSGLQPGPPYRTHGAHP